MKSNAKSISLQIFGKGKVYKICPNDCMDDIFVLSIAS